MLAKEWIYCATYMWWLRYFRTSLSRVDDFSAVTWRLWVTLQFTYLVVSFHCWWPSLNRPLMCYTRVHPSICLSRAGTVVSTHHCADVPFNWRCPAAATTGSQQQACCVGLCTLSGRASIISAVNHADTFAHWCLANGYLNYDIRPVYIRAVPNITFSPSSLFEFDWIVLAAMRRSDDPRR